jgi:nicotinamide mononucleotide adenylyltransferase
MGLLNVVAMFAVVCAVGISLEYIAARTRRPRLRAWLSDQDLSLRSCRYSIRLLRPWSYFRTLVAFNVEVVDRTGHVTTGTAWVSGRIRRQIWVDWD